LRVNLWRWGELRQDAQRAAAIIRGLQQRSDNLPFDNRLDPNSANERSAQLEADLRRAEPEFQVLRAFAEIIAAINQQAPAVAGAAQCRGINSAALGLFVVDLNERHWEAARAVVAQLSAMELGSPGGTSGRRRAGRRRKTEKDSAAEVIAALSKHHGYDEDGSVTNREPATNQGLAEAYGLSNNALTRFLAAKLGEGANKQYKAACRTGRVGAFLTLWRGELASHHTALRPGEDAEEDSGNNP
jgi:hypothetical protein